VTRKWPQGRGGADTNDGRLPDRLPPSSVTLPREVEPSAPKVATEA